MNQHPHTCVLVTGANGQLGRALQRCVPAGIDCVALNHTQLDITDTQAVARALTDYTPQAVINAAAYTAVDRAEQEPERAAALNAIAPGQLARLTADRGIRLLHISTDFVFDGRSSRPYKPDDATNPINVYGKAKLAGEQAVLTAQPGALILRTAWVYSPDGHNFVKTMLKLMTTREEVSVVADQIGTPTSADGLARALWTALQKGLSGIHHWTDAGVASWYDFAVAIAEEAIVAGILKREPIVVRPISTENYPTPARRPAFSVLDKTGTWAALALPAEHWSVALRLVLNAIQEQARSPRHA